MAASTGFFATLKLLWEIRQVRIDTKIIPDVVTIFLEVDGIPVYLNPGVISKKFVAAFGVNLVFNVAWVFTWNYELFIWAEVLLILLAVTNCIVTALISRNLAKHNHRLQKVNPKIYWSYVIMGQFGHQLYATWSIIAAIFQLIVPAHYWWGIDMEILSIATIATLLVVLCLWFMADISIWYTYQPYSIIPYLGILWGFSGVLDRTASQLIRNQAVVTFIGFILALNTGFLLIKIALLVNREKKRLFRSNQIYY
ncbi:hypothetical protein TCAL_13400 [Tigriopus californicus]|uniref:Uncharacterized protein n=1 Tax=Tigriopus californicus TaxID=6832 RepID=A0A553PQX1_TIGCA|nr:hypothetical protein TCAL_13400 [Tigriopus californicus]